MHLRWCTQGDADSEVTPDQFHMVPYHNSRWSI